jgi:hypothetical protein
VRSECLESFGFGSSKGKLEAALASVVGMSITGGDSTFNLFYLPHFQGPISIWPRPILLRHELFTFRTLHTCLPCHRPRRLRSSDQREISFSKIPKQKPQRKSQSHFAATRVVLVAMS